MQHTTSQTTAVQSSSHYQSYILVGKQWQQLPEFIPSNSNSGFCCCFSISVYTPRREKLTVFPYRRDIIGNVFSLNFRQYSQVQDRSGGLREICKNVTVVTCQKLPYCTLRWLGGIVVRASDSWSRGCEFNPRPRHQVTTLSKLFTPMCLCHQAEAV